jgi:hypothetical protein
MANELTNDNNVMAMFAVMLVMLSLLVYAIFFKNKKDGVSGNSCNVRIVDKELYSPFLNYFQTAAVYINTIIYYNDNIIGSTGAPTAYTRYNYDIYTRGASGNYIYGGHTGYSVPIKNTSKIFYNKSVIVNNKYKKWLDDNKYTYTLTPDSNDIVTRLATLKDSNDNNIIVTTNDKQYFVDKSGNSISLKEYFDSDRNVIFEISDNTGKLVVRLYLMNNIAFNSDYSGITGNISTDWV